MGGRLLKTFTITLFPSSLSYGWFIREAHAQNILHRTMKLQLPSAVDGSSLPIPYNHCSALLSSAYKDLAAEII